MNNVFSQSWDIFKILYHTVCMSIAKVTGKYSVERKDRNSYINFTGGENILPYSTF